MEQWPSFIWFVIAFLGTLLINQGKSSVYGLLLFLAIIIPPYYLFEIYDARALPILFYFGGISGAMAMVHSLESKKKERETNDKLRRAKKEAGLR